MTRFLIIASSILVSSCQGSSDNNQKNNENKVQTNFSIVDTLEKYSGADSVFKFYDTHNMTLIVGKANSLKYGIVGKTDTSIILFQNSNTNWHSTDTVEFPFSISNVVNEDINGDDRVDLKVYAIADANRNLEPRVFVYNSSSQKYEYRPQFNLPNVEYSKDLKLVRSWAFAGINHSQQKFLYSVIGDSLVLNSGVIYTPSDKDVNMAELELVKEVGGKQIVTEKSKGTKEKVWSDFEKALWDSSS